LWWWWCCCFAVVFLCFVVFFFPPLQLDVISKSRLQREAGISRQEHPPEKERYHEPVATLQQLKVVVARRHKVQPRHEVAQARAPAQGQAGPAGRGQHQQEEVHAGV
jgi:hypothetical protein